MIDVACAALEHAIRHGKMHWNKKYRLIISKLYESVVLDIPLNFLIVRMQMLFVKSLFCQEVRDLDADGEGS